MLWYPLDDEIEALVIACAPGQLIVADAGPFEVGKGLHSIRVPLKAGIPSARLLRDGEVVASLTGLAEVIDGVEQTPYRQLLEPHMCSSDFDVLFCRDVDEPFDPTQAMWTDSNGSGLADWYELIQAGVHYKVRPRG